jgi:2-methylisocitrate lyase-like PEP mutase family enzyme
MMKSTKRIRQLLARNGILVAPGAYDALSARIIQTAGFESMITSGLGISASYLGMPDAGLISFAENLSVVRNIVECVDIPVLADADTGYGNAINVIRTLQAFETAGAAGVSIEDQMEPKKCPAIASGAVPLVSVQEMVGKIKAAVDVRSDPDFVIAARTDAHGDEAIDRACAYAEAGADIIKPTSNAFNSPDGLRRFVNLVQKPVWIMMIRWIEETLSVQDLEKAKVKVVSCPVDAILLAASAVKRAMIELLRTGTNRGYSNERMSIAEFKELVGMGRITELEKKYLPEA